MAKEIPALLLGVIVIIIVGLGGYFISRLNPTAPAGGVCTMDAKECPDGSYVGRVPPSCEFAACPGVSTTTQSGGGGGILPYKSGIKGVVLLGPTCPVQKNPPDPACADKPYGTTISVTHLGSTAVFATAQSDKAGMFQLSLPPGTYTVSAKGGATLPRCASQDVTVGPTSYVQVTISCDTGIR